MPPEQPPVVELLTALAGVLRRLEVGWYLFGAQAVTVWGRPRMSADVDVTVQLDLSRVPSFVETMTRSGFTLRVRSDVDDFVARTRVLPFLHEPTRLPLDVVLAGPGIEEQFLSRARWVDIGGIEVPVLSAEDLVVTKILAGRGKDHDDVAGILREQGDGLDFERIRATLRLLEGALDQSDLVPAFEDELARSRR